MSKRKPGGQPGNTNAKSQNPKTSWLQVKCTPAQKKSWFEAAAAGEKSLSEWVIETLDANI